MQTEAMKKVIKIANMSKSIPTSKNMVAVSSLLSKVDLARIDEYHMGTVAVKVGNDSFFLSQQHKVPADAVILRDQKEQVLGIPAVVGG